jgi:hypothetical protein
MILTRRWREWSAYYLEPVLGVNRNTARYTHTAV